ncbi:hypothetical protein ZWY2020_033631 [Hordeum vulgare]|nr:hypothetical protein ZWY2020_033631 [Hordeum vulgare]
MQVVLCDLCPPCAPDPAAPAGTDGGHYEELPVSVPPHVSQGLSKDDTPGLGPDQWEEGAYAEAVEQLPAPPPEITETGADGGYAWPWLRTAFASVYEMVVVVPVSFCGRP